jgi:invasion protein IalB
MDVCLLTSEHTQLTSTSHALFYQQFSFVKQAKLQTAKKRHAAHLSLLPCAVLMNNGFLIKLDQSKKGNMKQRREVKFPCF